MGDEAMKTINRHLRFSSLKVEEVCPKNKRTDSHRLQRTVRRYCLNTLVPFVNLKLLSLIHTYDWLELARCVSVLFRFCGIIKFFSLSAIYFKLERVREELSLASTVSALGTRCINQSSIDSPNIRTRTTIIEEIGELEEWLRFFGLLLRTFDGFTSTTLLIGALTSVAFDFFGPIVIHFRQPRLDVYGFIKDRQSERRRFVNNIKSLVDDLFICHRQVDSTNQSLVAYTYTTRGGQHPVQAFVRFGNTFSRLFMNNFSNRIAKPRAKDSFSIVGQRKLHQLIEPAHLTDSWHRKLCLLLRKLTPIGFLMCFGCGQLVLSCMIIFDIGRRTRYRLEVFECLRENKSLSHYYTIPLKLRDLGSGSENSAYKNHDGSLANLLKLFLIEFKVSYGWREALLYIDIVQLLFFLSFEFPLYMGIYVAQYGSKTLWLKQIQLQVKGCINSLIESVKMTEIKQRIDTTNQRNEQNNNMKLITLAYLNFELFRREQTAYQSLTNFLLMQMMLVTVPLVIAAYLTLALLKQDDRIIMLIFVSYAFSFLNIYLVASAIRTHMALKLMNDMSRLLAYITENHIELTLVARLWSSQILNYKETMDRFAPKILGISISFDKIVNLNAYLLAVGYLSFRAWD